MGQSADSFCSELFSIKNNGNALKLQDFKAFLVAEDGLDPTSILF